MPQDHRSIEQSGHAVVWTERRISDLVRQNARLLIVDDYIDGAEAITAALGFEGFDTRFVTSGIDALESLDAWRPHLILLDLNMPEHDGFQTAKVIRGIDAFDDIVVVAFSALSRRAVEVKAMASGFDGYCQKALPVAVLVSLIERFIPAPESPAALSPPL